MAWSSVVSAVEARAERAGPASPRRPTGTRSPALFRNLPRPGPHERASAGMSLPLAPTPPRGRSVNAAALNTRLLWSSPHKAAAVPVTFGARVSGRVRPWVGFEPQRNQGNRSLALSTRRREKWSRFSPRAEGVRGSADNRPVPGLGGTSWAGLAPRTSGRTIRLPPCQRTTPPLTPGCVVAWAYFLLAGLFEIGWAVGLKYSNGFTRFWPSSSNPSPGGSRWRSRSETSRKSSGQASNMFAECE